MAQSTHIKLGYLRDPENHNEMFFPYTHHLGVVGLDSHVNSLISQALPEMPTKLSDLTNDLTATGNITLNGNTFNVLIPYGNTLDSSFYAPTSTGTNGNILKSIGSGTPVWDSLENIIGSKTQHHVLAGNASGNVSWQQLSLNSISGTDDLKAIEALSGTGMLKRTGNDTWSLIDAMALSSIAAYPSIATGLTASTIGSNGAKLGGDIFNLFAGDNVTLKQVKNGSGTVVGFEISGAAGVSSSWQGTEDSSGNNATNAGLNIGGTITKISTGAISNDTGVTLILNGNFS